MEIRYINQTFAAGVATEVGLGGRYFRVISCVNPFTLEVGNNGAFNAKIEGAGAGDWGRCDVGQDSFTSLRITTTGLELVKIEVTDGQIGRDSQSADVSDRAGRILGALSGRAHVQAKKTAAAASAQMLAANSLRSYLSVQSPSSATNSVFIRTDGTPAVADATCFELLPGQTWAPQVPPVGEIRFIRGAVAAADVDLNVIEAS